MKEKVVEEEKVTHLASELTKKFLNSNLRNGGCNCGIVHSASHVNTNLNLGCFPSNLAPCNVCGKATEDGPEVCGPLSLM